MKFTMFPFKLHASRIYCAGFRFISGNGNGNGLKGPTILQISNYMACPTYSNMMRKISGRQHISSVSMIQLRFLVRLVLEDKNFI